MKSIGSILAVDDTPMSLALLVKLLGSKGYQVYQAASGESALAAATANPPDLILLDINMKGMNGFEVCRRLKAREDTRHIPIIFVSAYTDIEQKLEGFKLGAVDYITKPFHLDELLVHVSTHVALSRANISTQQQASELSLINEQLQSEIEKRQQIENELHKNLDRAELSRRSLLSTMEDLKRKDDALLESEERFRAISEYSHSAICIVDESARIIWINDKMVEISGYSHEQIMAFESFISFIAPESVEFVVSNLNEFAKGNEYEHHYQFMIIRANGEKRLIEKNMMHYMDIQGRKSLIISLLDITDRIQMENEKKKLQSQLSQAQKMESIGRLAGGVAHDFNNMLQVILGNADLALNKIRSNNRARGHLEEILKAAERSADLTQQLLTFARKQTIAPKVLDMNEIVAGMMKMLQRFISEDIELAWMPGANLWPVEVDPSQIDQILANLCLNARDAIDGVGKIIIETENSIIDKEYCSINDKAVPGEYIRLTVSDNGHGMDQETLSHIFEPFYTTKGVGEGTGLGLSTVYGAVTQNNGFINAYSEPEHGTTFTIYLPHYTGKVKLAGTVSVRGVSMRGHETILLVEDDTGILKLGESMLSEQGYNVLTANSPIEAIKIAREYDGEINMLMTDVVMPEMNGSDLSRRLLALYPNLKCLFMSGYTANIIAHRGILDEGVSFLQKPFSMHDLTTKVREILDKKK